MKQNDVMGMKNGQNEPENEFTLDIKYNGEQMSLDKQRATELAQKGMNYDHVYEELKRLRENPELEKLNKLAQAAGMSTGELLDMLLNEDETNPEMQNEQEKEQKNEQQGLEELIEFFKKHPQLAKEDGLPEEVRQAALNGGDIEGAYLKYENRVLKEKLAEMENVRKTPGALHTEGRGNEDDAFARMLLARL